MHPTEPVTGQIYISAAEDMAILIESSEGSTINVTATEFRPPATGDGMDIIKRPIRLSADEWAEMKRAHGLTLKSQ